MAISPYAVHHLISGACDRTLGNLVADAVNQAQMSSHLVAGVIVATAVSPTTDFASLLVGDRVVIITAAAGQAQHVLVATKGTLPQAAVVGSLYVVIRAADARSNITY